MQVARNFFLTREKTITRKLREVLLAWKIEANLSKDEILQLYLNQIFLGQRAYGFAAASQIYFGKPLKDVTPAEAAMLAGLPKAPSAFNPVTNPKRAKTRQLYVLRRMHDLRFLTDVQYKEAQTAPLAVRQGLREAAATRAEFVAEMARQVVFDAYGEDAYTRGLTVYTTIRKADQEAAYAALRRGVLDYDRRHGYRGPEAFVSLPDDRAGVRDGTRARVPGGLGQRRAAAGGRAGGEPDRGRGGAGATARGQGHRRRAAVRRAVAGRQGRSRDAAPTRGRDPARPRRQGALDDRAAAAGRSGVRLASGPSTARSSRWSAASTSTATSSTT